MNEQNANSEEFDKKAQQWYNNNKDEQGMVRINTKLLKPLYDVKCDHDWYEDPLDGDASWSRVFKCRKCPVGKLVNK